MTTVSLIVDEPIGHVSPRLYGHFAEHLARCCYDGLWVGEGNPEISNTRGFRNDVIDALRDMPTPFLRWPGGCYADHYHWRDGIGPKPERPRRLGLSCGLSVEDDNSLGTHEFLDLCDMIGAEPYLAGNMGSGSVQEMCDWVEYCNATVDTNLVRERVANAHKEPFNVRVWGVGNENWGCGGCYSPESYALEYRRYASMVRHVDKRTELVACGHDTDWNRKLIEGLRNHLDLVSHFSIHRYWINGGPGVEFDESAYYRLLAEADDTELFVEQTREIIKNVTGEQRHIGIALDEWGVWHPEARGWGPGGVSEPSKDYGQAATVRDAIAVAAALEGFHRQCQSLSMANLAQVVNVLHAPIFTEGKDMWLTPTYHVLRLHKAHVGATAIRTQCATPALPDSRPSVTATATVMGDAVSTTVTNRHFSEAAEVTLARVSAVAIKVPVVTEAKYLVSTSPHDHNSAMDREKVRLEDLTVLADGDKIRFVLPPHSVATVSLA